LRVRAEELQIAQLDGMLAANLTGHARHRNRLAAAIERRTRILRVNSFERGGEPVGIAFAPLLAVGNDVEAGALLVPNGNERRLILSGFTHLTINQPEIVHPHARHHLGQPRAVDQPVRLRIGADERSRKESVCHPGLLVQPATSARTILAPSTIAHIFPNATSRGRYFRPQSGATTMRSAD